MALNIMFFNSLQERLLAGGNDVAPCPASPDAGRSAFDLG
jgi:hypothetical protein